MSYAWLSGLLIGVILALGAGLLQRKRIQQECDERTALIKTQSGSTAFYLSGGFVLLAWLYDNAQAYLAGEPPRVVSPWSMMLAAMLFIALGARLYHNWQFSVLANLDEQEKGQVRKRSAALLFGAAALGGSARLAFEREQAGLGWFLIAFMVVEVAVGLYLYMVATKRSANQ